MSESTAHTPEVTWLRQRYHSLRTEYGYIPLHNASIFEEEQINAILLHENCTQAAQLLEWQ
jgi:hypothetical protein